MIMISSQTPQSRDISLADVVVLLFAEWSFLLCICLFGGHALSFLSTRWSVGFRSRGEARHVGFFILFRAILDYTGAPHANE
jgi:hypothetical protein